MRTSWRTAARLLATLALAAPACGGDGGAAHDAGPGDSAVEADTGAHDGAGGDAAPADGGGDAAPDPALDAKCTPTFTLQLEDTGANAHFFTDAVPDPEPFVQEVGRSVCRILYRHADEVRDANHITLIIRDDPDYPGWKAGDVGDITVMISTHFLAIVAGQGRSVLDEITGVLLHEMTHMYQNDDQAAGEGTYARLGNVVEGVADFVRIRAGHTPSGATPAKTGEWDDVGYTKPAFFLLWIDGRHPDFLYRLNLSMAAGDGVAWSPDAFATITGESVAALWSEYGAAACCAGATRTCCR
jgi:hypothetical protein